MDAYEIEVYDGSSNAPGHAGVELHANRDPRIHETHLTLEPSYGVTRAWEIGGYLESAFLADGSYASAFRVLTGYHLVHLFLLAFLGFGLLNRARAGAERTRTAAHVRLVRYFWDWVAVAAVLTAITTWFVASPRPA